MRRRELGLEWRGRTLAAVELEESPGGPTVAGSARRSWPPDAPVTSEGVREALSEGGIGPGPAVLALGGPEVSVKPLWLPPVPEPTLASMLREEGDRYFLLPPGPRCYGLFPAGTAAGGREEAEGERRRWVAAAPAPEVTGLLDALEGAGVHVRRVTASEAVYPALARLATAGSAWPEAVLRVTEEGAERVRYRNGAPEEILRLDPGAAGEDAPGRGERPGPAADGGRLLLLADPGNGPPASAGLVRPDLGLPEAGSFAGALAAALSEPDPGEGPDLMPVEARRTRRRRRRRTTAALAGAVALLLALAVWLGDRRGERREALVDRQVREARAAAAPVIERKAGVARVARQLAAFREAAGSGPSHLRFLTSVSGALPEGAWIVSYVSRDDRRETLLTGYAPSATRALARLSELPGVEAVRFDRPTRKVEVADATFESFTVAVTLGTGG